jgi:hypothetical protein
MTKFNGYLSLHNLVTVIHRKEGKNSFMRKSNSVSQCNLKKLQKQVEIISHVLCKIVFWTLFIVYISIKLQHFGSWIFFCLQVKKRRTETLAVGPPG